MAKTIAQLHTEAQTIRDETVTAANTATRVGGCIDDVVEYIEDDVALENGNASIQIDLSGLTSQNRNINSVTYLFESVLNVNCRIYPVTVSGTYTVKAVNGLGGCAVLTSNDTTIGVAAQFDASYPSLINMSQGDTVTLNLTAGVYLYVRDDTNPNGRVLPEVFRGTINPVLRQSDITAIRRKTINCLFVGNSVNQDHIGYLPWLLKNTYGNDVDFRICLAYKASYTIKEYVIEILSGNQNLDIFSVSENTQQWTNSNNYPFADIWANYGSFDLISFEGYFNHSDPNDGYVEDTTYFAAFIDYLRSVNTTPFKLGYLLHQTYTTATHTEADAWARIVNGAIFAIRNNPVSIIFPCGMVTRIAKQSISQSILTNDNIHNQQGIPCIMGAYCVMEELARYYGLLSKILNNPLRITSAIESALQIPCPNGTLQVGTETQYQICQDAAIRSVKWGDYLLVSNSEE